MKYRIKFLLNKFAVWLWYKTHVVTATEMMIMKEASKTRKCEHCGLDPIHYFDKKCCKESEEK